MPNFLSARVGHLDESNTVQLGEDKYDLELLLPTMQYVHDERAFPPRFCSEVSGSRGGGFLEVASTLNTKLRADNA